MSNTPTIPAPRAQPVIVPTRLLSSLVYSTARYNNAEWINDLGFVLAVLGYTTDSYNYRNQPYTAEGGWPAQVRELTLLVLLTDRR